MSGKAENARFRSTGNAARVGLLAAVVVAILTFAPLVAVALRAESWSGLSVADWAAFRFTLLQAALSALISVMLAVPLARALARRQFRGRALVIALLGAPFILPVIVAVLGLLAVFGRAGLLNSGLTALGLSPVSVYGLHGILLAHVFFNLPLATRLVLQGWLSIPAEQFRLAATLDFGPGETFRLIEVPMLRQVLPGALLAVFLICLTSFAVALTLGGGPRATTLELAIYQAFRFDFDLGKAALLALMQLALGAGAALLAMGFTLPELRQTGLDRAVRRWDVARTWLKVQDALIIGLAVLFLILPLALIVARGAPEILKLDRSLITASLRSLAVAFASSIICLTLALSLSAWAVRRGRAWPVAFGMLTLAASPLVAGTGLFIITFPFVDPRAVALPMTALVNALMSLPFVLRILHPALAATERSYGPLADQLGLTGLARLRLLWLPRLRRPLGFATGLSAALSVGDLGVIALFSAPDSGTLPLALYRLMGAYRMDEAAGAALLLLVLAFGLFALFDRGGRVNADA